MPVVWLIEDNAAFRSGVESALKVRADIQKPRAFSRCEDALEVLSKGERPDVILLDVGLPGIDGIEGIRRIKAIIAEVSIVVLTVFSDDDKIFRAICAGASGYLLKSEPIQKIMESIDLAVAGGSPMNAQVARRVLEMFSKLSVPRKDYGLNERERMVLDLMVNGRSQKQVADELKLNPHTVDYVIRCIYRKLEVNCLANAVSVAVKDGIVSPRR